MTLTLPALARARTVLWLVTGAIKSDALGRAVVGDPIVPAGRVERAHAIVFADDAATLLLDLPHPHAFTPPHLPAP
jgi:6-phosphogluconolactonase/glucosamine-6-phosphate isomerase/deaminase